MNDMIGQPVQVDDNLIDDRGKLYLVQPTDLTYQAELLALGREKTKSGVLGVARILRLGFSLKVSEELLNASPQARRKEWERVYKEQVFPIKRIEVRDRRKDFQERIKQRGS